MRAPRRLTAFTAATLSILSSVAFATPPSHPTMVGAAAASASAQKLHDRWYFTVPGGDEDRLLALYHRLVEAGASRAQVFLPDVMVCDVPVDVDASAMALDAGADAARANDAARLSVPGLSVSPAALAHVDAVGRRALGSPPATVTPETLSDLPLSAVRTIPEEAMRESAARASDGDERLIHQNAEIMAGTMLIHVILPESDYSGLSYWYENWTDEDIAQIKLGFYYALLSYQDFFRNAGIDVIYRYHERVLIKAEPIRLPEGKQSYWLWLTMRALDYPGPEADIMQTVHQFNEDAREKVGADWAFSMFIACAHRAIDHIFPDSRVLSWSILGGPYTICSYPAAALDQAWGFTFLARHQIGHMFWGLEENQGPVSSCDDHSGYLDEDNGNKVTEFRFVNGGWQRAGCNEQVNPVDCVMNEFDMYSLHAYQSDPCKFSSRMFGVSDENDNLVPDAFDRPPRIEFDSADTETVTTLPGYLGVRVFAQAIPNENPLQPADLRRNYAAPIKNIDVAVGGLRPYTLDPEQLDSDGYEAEFQVVLPPPIPGWLRIDVRARNSYEAQSTPRVKKYLYVDLAFQGFEVRYPNDGVALSWQMVGETFDADLRVLRRDRDTGETVVVADGVEPSSPRAGGVTPYRVLDRDVEIGARYEYTVHGTIDLPYRGGFLHREVDSGAARVQGAVPRTHSPVSPISDASPNPFRDRTWLSVSVPDVDAFSEGRAEGELDEALATPVSVTVYDVLGRRVTHLFNRRVITRALTVSWDGTDDSGRPVPSGVYFFNVAVGQTHEVRKVLLVR